MYLSYETKFDFYLCLFFQKSSEAYIEHLIPSARGPDGTLREYAIDPTFGRKVVRMIVTESCETVLAIEFLSALREIRHVSLKYDLVDRKSSAVDTQHEPTISKSTNKQLQVLALIQQQMDKRDYAYRRGKIFMKREESK